MGWSKQRWSPPREEWPELPTRARKHYGARPYTVCACKLWRYDDKGSACLCGAGDSPNGAKDELAVALQVLLRLVGTQKPEELFAELHRKCPDVFEAAAAEANKGPEPVTLASARKAYAEASKIFKELVTKKEMLTKKVEAQAKQLAASQTELEDTIAKVVEAQAAQADCSLVMLEKSGPQGGPEGASSVPKQQGGGSGQGGEERAEVDADVEMEEASPQEKDALDKLQEALGPDHDKRKLLDDFILVTAKRKRKDLSKASASEAMEAGAAAAAMVEAAAKGAKSAAAKAEADRTAGQGSG